MPTVTDLLRMTDEELYEGDEAADDERVRALADTGQVGLGLVAPAAIELALRDALPLVLLRQTTGQRDWEVAFRRNAQLVAADLDSGAVTVRYAFPTRKRYDPARLARSMDGPAPDEQNADALASELYRFDARALCELPWRPGALALTFVDYELCSNTVVVALVGPGAPAPTPLPAEGARALGAEVRAALAALARPVVPPADPGIVLVVPAAVAADAGAVVVHGLVRTALPTGALVAHDGDPATPRAILRGRLLLAKKDELYPPACEILVPVHAPGPVAAGDELMGAFALDLRTALGQPLEPGRYLVYAVIGPHVAGPQLLEVQAPA
ncbi:MAG: hypothetical protein HY908_26585 [Myxococcales bacterium]|nr:hypothetical protein [Myxococcales bacterium]